MKTHLFLLTLLLMELQRKRREIFIQIIIMHQSAWSTWTQRTCQSHRPMTMISSISSFLLSPSSFLPESSTPPSRRIPTSPGSPFSPYRIFQTSYQLLRTLQTPNFQNRRHLVTLSVLFWDNHLLPSISFLFCCCESYVHLKNWQCIVFLFWPTFVD